MESKQLLILTKNESTQVGNRYVFKFPRGIEFEKWKIRDIFVPNVFTSVVSNLAKINTNITNISGNDVDIATNVTNIATNVTNIALKANKASPEISGSLTLKDSAGAGGKVSLLFDRTDHADMNTVFDVHSSYEVANSQEGLAVTVPAGVILWCDERKRIGINTSDPSETLDVAGNCNISSGSLYKINGTQIAMTNLSDDPSSAITANTAKVTYPGSADATELNILDGATLSTTELNYVDGVTSAIQTQMDTKAPIATPTFTTSIKTPIILADSALDLKPDGAIKFFPNFDSIAAYTGRFTTTGHFRMETGYGLVMQKTPSSVALQNWSSNGASVSETMNVRSGTVPFKITYDCDGTSHTFTVVITSDELEASSLVLWNVTHTDGHAEVIKRARDYDFNATTGAMTFVVQSGSTYDGSAPNTAESGRINWMIL